jgi:hypothetical protein
MCEVRGTASAPSAAKTRLVESYEALVADRHPAPARELALRLDTNHETVKSWLRRGRKYLKEE